MLHSMTGFGSAIGKEECVGVAVELKTVNNRYFKLALRMTDGYSAFEQRIENLLRHTIERGTINATIKITVAKEIASYHIKVPVLHSYMREFAEAMRTSDHAHGDLWQPCRPEHLLTLPGVIVADNEQSDVDNEKHWPLLEKTLREALHALQSMRRTEGESMAKALLANVESLHSLLSEIAGLAPRVPHHYRQKLQERIAAVLEEHGFARDVVSGNADFVRELATFADRCDISEELVRFQSHLQQCTAAIHSSESSGRKLDFLTQELFREANTIGAKASDPDITRHVVEIKTVIERFREMVQNVE